MEKQVMHLGPLQNLPLPLRKNPINPDQPFARLRPVVVDTWFSMPETKKTFSEFTGRVWHWPDGHTAIDAPKKNGFPFMPSPATRAEFTRSSREKAWELFKLQDRAFRFPFCIGIEEHDLGDQGTDALGCAI